MNDAMLPATSRAPESGGAAAEVPAEQEGPARAPAQPPPSRWGFAAAILGRLWLSLVTGMLLIATVPPILLPGWSAHVVLSDSMAPRINAGDVVVSQDRDDYQAGQVIVFEDESRGAITHRVQSVQGDTFTTKGDANITADSSPVEAEDVIGLGRVLVMFAGLPWVWYHTGQWALLALFVLSLLLSAWAVARDRAEASPKPPLADPPDQESRASGDGAHEQVGIEDLLGNGATTEHSDRGSETERLMVVPEDEEPGPEVHGDDAAGDAGTPKGDVSHIRFRGRDWFAGVAGSKGRRLPPSCWIPSTGAALAGLALLGNSIPSASAAFSARTTNDTNTWKAAITVTYVANVLADNPYLYLRLNEAPPTPPADPATYPAVDLGTYPNNYLYTRAASPFTASFTLGSPSSANLTPTPNTSAQVRVDNACILAPNDVPSLTNPQTFTIEAWIRSTGSAGGKIVGFENQRTTQATRYDRHLYQDQQGYVRFGIYNNSNTAVTIRSPTPLNDNAWHHVMGVLTSANGSMRLYVDGAQVAGSPLSAITAENFTGWWRVGCGNLSGWPTGTPGLTGQHSFIGFIDEPAVYQTALTAADAADRWAIGKP